jgi:hypothetical protein
MIYKTKQIPQSISATYYSLEHKYWFGITMLLTAAFLMPVMLEVTPENYTYLAFFSCIGVVMVAVAPNFREAGIDQVTHRLGATISILASQLWIYFMNPKMLFIWIIPVMVYILKYLRFKYVNNVLFWIEVCAFASIYITLLR